VAARRVGFHRFDDVSFDLQKTDATFSQRTVMSDHQDGVGHWSPHRITFWEHGHGMAVCNEGVTSSAGQAAPALSTRDNYGAVVLSLTSQSQSHFLPQAEKFVLDPPYRALAGRRPYKLGVLLAPETGECTV
jgi:hypothetical protein